MPDKKISPDSHDFLDGTPSTDRGAAAPAGSDFVDTLQPEAVNMSPRYLAEHFGGRLNFRGCISTAGPLAYGTPEEVDAVCKDTLEVMMPVRGYHFAPTHQIQDNTPVENLIAMYNAAHKYGRY